MAYVTQRELNDARNDRIFDAVESAHNRFVRNRANFIESNPNAVSNYERSAILGRRQQMQDEDRLREHEMKMLQQTGQNDLEVARQNKLGMIGQGADAARLNSQAAIKKAELEAATGRAQFGFFDADGKYHGGSNVSQTKAQTKATLENARLEREARIKAAELNGQWHRDVAQTTAAGKTEAAKTTAAATVEAAEKKAGATVDAAKAKAAQAEEAKIARVKLDLQKGQFVSLGYTASKLKKMTPEELTEVATKIAGYQAEEATPPATTQTATTETPPPNAKEGDVWRTPQGPAVMKNGHWVVL